MEFFLQSLVKRRILLQSHMIGDSNLILAVGGGGKREQRGLPSPPPTQPSSCCSW